MPAIIKGTTFKYGTGSAGTPFSGVVIQTFKTGKEFALKVEAKDAEGVVVSRRYNDVTTKVSFSGLIPANATLPALGAVIAVGGVSIVVEKVEEDGKNDGNTVINIEGISSEGVAAVAT